MAKPGGFYFYRMELRIKSFDELTLHQLYKLLALRTDVFVVEQHCAYPEIDDYDPEARHIMGFQNDELIAYARVLPPNTVYEESSIGRVVVKKTFREKGYGREIFKVALAKVRSLFPAEPVKIQAQIYLEEFYAGFGFKTISEPYPDVGIMHVDMLYKPGN